MSDEIPESCYELLDSIDACKHGRADAFEYCGHSDGCRFTIDDRLLLCERLGLVSYWQWTRGWFFPKAAEYASTGLKCQCHAFARKVGYENELQRVEHACSNILGSTPRELSVTLTDLGQAYLVAWRIEKQEEVATPRQCPNDASDKPHDPKKRLDTSLPKLGRHDQQAWQLSQLKGWPQERIAKALNTKHGTQYGQGQVSRMIAKAKRHAEASGLSDLVPPPAQTEKAIDPHKIEIGRRTDGRTRRQRDQADSHTK